MVDKSAKKIVKASLPRKSAKKPLAAYFCMEYGLDADFYIFSGGLGILAGDLIKAAKDADYPLVAVGIMWRQGYTNQLIGKNGLPVDTYPEYRYPFLKDTGVTVVVKVKEKDIKCKVWLCDCFSNAPLYLLDAFLPENPDMLITGQLYGWFEEQRLAQEIILGVGGVRALDALGIKPDVYHFNEGHAVLAGLEMMKLDMAKSLAAAGAKASAPLSGEAAQSAKDARRKAFVSAWEDTRKKIVFTTHTPVPEGNESHGYRALQYVGADLGFSKAELKQIGGEPFNMTVAGLRLSRKSNAVAELHAVTAKKMWAGVKKASNIIYVTNGVHNGTWQDGELAKIVAEYRCASAGAKGEAGNAGGAREAGNAANKRGAGIAGGAGEAGNAVAKSGACDVEAAGERIWARHTELKNQMIDGVRERTGVQLDAGGLIAGFARRAAPYKRSDLIFRDRDRIEFLFKNENLQLIFSGKSHPNDPIGKAIIANLVEMTRLYPKNVVFLQDYDMRIGAMLTRGCDIWLNNPVRPQEASGTSGMKAAMNGVLNLSVLDGWWPEGCKHGENGWQIGGGYEGEDCDNIDADSLYKVLAEEVIPAFYNDRPKWIEMMANSVAMSQYQFSAARMLEEYVELMYR